MAELEPERAGVPLTDLARQTFEKGRQLGRDEMRFAKAELSLALRNLKGAALWFGLAFAGGIALLSALDNLLSLALMAAGLAPVWAALASFVIVACVAMLTAWRGAVLARRSAAAPGTILNKFSADLRSLKEILK